MPDGDPTLNAPPDDSPIGVSPMVSQSQTQTPSVAPTPPAAQNQDPTEKAYTGAVNQLIDTINQHKRDDANYMAQSESSWAAFQKQMGELNAAQSQKTQLQELPSPPDAQSRLNWGTTFGNILSMVAIASVVFGKHGGGYKQAIQMSAVGAFVNGIQQGHEVQAKNALDQWKEQTALIEKQNAEKLKADKETLDDKKLSLQEMMDVIKTRAELSRESRTYNAAATKDLTELVKVLHDKTQANLAYKKANEFAARHMTDEFFKTPGAAGWRAEIMKRYGADADPAKSSEAFEAAQQKYPLEEYKTESKAGTVEENADHILETIKPGSSESDNLMKGLGLP